MKSPNLARISPLRERVDNRPVAEFCGFTRRLRRRVEGDCFGIIIAIGHDAAGKDPGHNVQEAAFAAPVRTKDQGRRALEVKLERLPDRGDSADGLTADAAEPPASRWRDFGDRDFGDTYIRRKCGNRRSCVPKGWVGGSVRRSFSQVLQSDSGGLICPFLESKVGSPLPPNTKKSRGMRLERADNCLAGNEFAAREKGVDGSRGRVGR